MSDAIRWGILSTGAIAKKFADGLKSAQGAELVAVGSRTQAAADTFGEAFSVPHRHGSYADLANDPDVDAIYIGTPHSAHKDSALLCLDAGKAVLCEKPFAINASETRAMIVRAREKKLFLMEAMWTRFIPLIVRVRELLAEGVIGEPRMVSADFGFRAGVNPEGRLFNPHLGGGGLLDVGIYTLSFASMVFGRPAGVVSAAHLGETGVDEQAAMILRYDQGQLAVLSTAVRTTTPHEATIMGTGGRIRIHSRFWCPQKMTVSVDGKEDEVIEMPFTGNGYHFEAEETMQCLREGKTESAVMPLDETLELMETMDEIRGQWGLKYPME